MRREPKWEPRASVRRQNRLLLGIAAKACRQNNRLRFRIAREQDARRMLQIERDMAMDALRMLIFIDKREAGDE